MKRLISSLIVLLLLTGLLAGCSAQASTRPVVDENRFDDYKLISGASDMGYAIPNFNVDFMQEKSSNIVKGYLLDDAKADLQYDSYKKDLIVYGMTISTLVITKVYKGDLKPGDEVQLAEFYYIAEQNGEKYIWGDSGSTPSIPGKDYIFFMGPSDDRYEGMYVPNGYMYGRYPALTSSQLKNADTLTSKQLSIAPEEYIGERETEKYRDFMEEVLTRFK